MKLKPASDGRVQFWCPGCENAHYFDDRWTRTGTDDAPTFAPSLLTRGADSKNGTCHLFLTAGQLSFLADSTHSLAGKSVPLPDWPYP